jgi:myo-inositol-1(or 4)-monophosphatase
MATPDPALLGELLATAVEAAEGAAGLLASGFGRDRVDVDTKSSPTDVVTEMDRAAEATVAATLARLRPADGLLGEEGTVRPSSTGVRWIVDPLDGTTNYLFGLPAWCVSVAAEAEGRTVAGAVVDPSRGERWTARLGLGAERNGHPLRLGPVMRPLAESLVATGFSYLPERRAVQARLLARVLPEVRDIRRFGSAALDLCWVAAGRFDAYYEWGLQPWDSAAGALVAAEAGAARAEVGRTLVVAAPGLLGPLTALLERAGVADGDAG